MSENRKKVGLVLGGGGAKGVAHIGVLKVLQANDIPIDYIAGTSMGAVVAGLYAFSRDPDYLEKIFIDKLTVGSALKMMFNPASHGGLIEGSNLEEWLNRWFKEAHFDNLEVPLAIIATDLNSGEPVTLREGSVVRAIRASLAVPPTLMPIEHQGRLLSDGWMSNPFPIEVVKQMGADIVIGSVLDTKSPDKPLTEEKSSTTDVFERGFNILSNQLMKQKIADADIMIWPQIGRVSFGGGGDRFMHRDLLIQDIAAGEAAAQKMVGEIKQLLSTR